MLKKYLPYIFLIGAALLLWYVKSHQRGPGAVKRVTVPETEHTTIPAILPEENKNGEFNRTATHIIYSKHAKCRMDCRHIDESEVKEILQKGEINYSRVETDEKGKSYPIEGVTHDNQHVRIVFAPKDDGLVVVTVIDLGTNWPCDCK